MIPSKSFYMVRHGESVHNAAHIAAGGLTDSPLSEKGHGQAKHLARFLDDLSVKPVRIYHSSMQRARDTALHLNDTLKLPMQEIHDLREHEIGHWEGQPWDTIRDRWRCRDNPDGGETNVQFAARIQRALTFCLEDCADGIPLIVAHGGLFFAIGIMYDMYEAITDIDNCQLHLFEPFGQAPFFPWRVARFQTDQTMLASAPAPFCVTRLIDRQAAG